MSSQIMQPKNHKRGRPATGVGTPIQVRLQDDLLAMVDQWRRNQPDLPGRPEAMRRLAEIALASAKSAGKTKKKR